MPACRQSHGKALQGTPAGFQKPVPRDRASSPPHQDAHEDPRAFSRCWPQLRVAGQDSFPPSPVIPPASA
eukprot:912948-Amphidinium_carterae.1